MSCTLHETHGPHMDWIDEGTAVLCEGRMVCASQNPHPPHPALCKLNGVVDVFTCPGLDGMLPAPTGPRHDL